MSHISIRSGFDIDSDDSIAGFVFAEIARRTADIAGVSRPAFSEAETWTLEFLKTFAEGVGLAAWFDAGQNLRISLKRDAKTRRVVVVGSHVDSVPQGGNYDGLAGIVAGVLCLLRAHRTGTAFARPVHVLALRGEESAWFGPCYIGSKALLGGLSPTDLAAPHKSSGRTLADHMAAIGIDSGLIARGTPLIDPADIDAYIELHIEQGPSLAEAHEPVAIVSAMRGNIRHRHVVCHGETGHSGAVPREHRKDPVFAFADLLMRLDADWSQMLAEGRDLVMTTGIVSTDPRSHAMSRIPDAISFSLDIRSQSEKTLNEAHRTVLGEAECVTRERGVRFTFDTPIETAPSACDPSLVARLKAAMLALARRPVLVASGAGHDAAVFQAAGIPSAMVFVRNRNGSHNPREAMDIADLLAGTDVIEAFLRGKGN